MNEVVRIWHGYTTQENAAEYQRLLQEEFFPGIQSRAIAGLKGLQILRRDSEGQSEFITIMRFESIDAVIAFAGADYEKAVVPEKARRVLSSFDAESAHYTLIEEQTR
jgi:heme-degrading monooxygenase HmoA